MITRRKFIKNTGLLAASATMSPSLTAAGKRIQNPGLQLYTFRKEMLSSPQKTLELIAGLGIKEIESASSALGLFYGLKPKEMKTACNDLGMTLRSAHTSLNNKWQDTVIQATESGLEYLICSSLPYAGQTADIYKKTAERFNKAGEYCKEAGIKFGYHNHDIEFDSDNGQVLYDILLDQTEPELVHMEMDLGWVVAAGKDPLYYFKKYGKRFPLWHLKDMKNRKSTEFGNGSLNIAELLKHRKQAGMKYFFVEQEDYSLNPLDSMRANITYLKKLNI